jgi:spore coat protein CotH
MERVDRKQLKLKKLKGNTLNGVLYKSVNWEGSFFKAITPYDNDSATWMRYEYQYPDIEDNLINWKPLYDAMLYVDTASAEEFAEGASMKYDIPVFMDYYLFTCLLSARDSRGKNLFFSYYNVNQNSKLLITPWDLDHSFGRMYNSGEESATTAFTWNDQPYLRFKSEIPQYDSLLIQRYAYLRENAFSYTSLSQRFDAYFDLFEQTGADAREMERWSGVDGITLNFSEEKKYVDAWIKQR